MTDFVCPFLGRADDRETAFAYASPGHRCFRLRLPSPITDSHQNSYCLTDAYAQCPVYRLASTLEPSAVHQGPPPSPEPVKLQYVKSEPPPQQPPEQPSGLFLFSEQITRAAVSLNKTFPHLFKNLPNQNPAVTAIFLTALAILIIAVLFFGIVAVTYFSRPPAYITPTVEAGIATEAQPSIFLITLTPTQRSAFIQKMGLSHVEQGRLLAPYSRSAPDATPGTAVITPTVKPAPARTNACGAPADWKPYIVQAGDSLTALTVVFDVPLSELSSYNCLYPDSSLFIGQEIWVPVE